MVRPDVAIITTIAPVHVEGFENGLDGIIEAKAEIFDGMAERGDVVLNRDHESFDILKEKAEAKGLKGA